jgi:hypothetical protein
MNGVSACVALVCICLCVLQVPLVVYAQESSANGEDVTSGIDAPADVHTQENEAIDPPASEVDALSTTEPQGESDIVEVTSTLQTQPSSEVVPSEIPPTDTGVEPVVDPQVLEIVETQEALLEEREEMVEVMAVVATQNTALPFALVSSTTFALNEIPTFVFTSEKDTPIQEVLQSVEDTIIDIYEGSVVETIVDAVIEVIETVVEAVIPSAEAQDTEVSASSSLGVAPKDVREVPVDTEAQDGVPQVSATATPATSTALTQPGISYAIVNDVIIPVTLTRAEDSFSVALNSIFDIGPHALSLHLILDDTLYVYNTVFTVDGVMVEKLPLVGTQVAGVIQDRTGVYTLWLFDYASSSLQSAQKITDFGELITDVPRLSFEAGTLLWYAPSKENFYGYDLNARSIFSQTQNEGGARSNTLYLDEGVFSVSDSGGVIDLTPQKTPRIP